MKNRFIPQPHLKYNTPLIAVFALLCLFFSSLQAFDSPVFLSKTALETPYLYQSVNVINGDYCEANTDFISPSHPQFRIRRCFSNTEGWDFNLLFAKKDLKPEAHPSFVYQEVLDALNRKTIYHYESGRLTGTDYYVDGALYKKERLFWRNDEISGHWILATNALQDGAGNAVKCQSYRYDSNGNQIEETLYGSLSGKETPLPMIDAKGVVQKNGTECYSKQRLYDLRAPFQLLSETEDNGKVTLYSYDQATLQKNGEFIGTADAILQRRIFEYDRQMRLTAILVDDGTSKEIHDMQGVTERHATTFTYHSDDTHSKNPEIVEEQYFDYDSSHFITTQRTIFSYDQQGNLQVKQVFNGNNTLLSSTTYSYDLFGRLIKESDDSGNSFEKTYDENGNLAVETLIKEQHLLKQKTYNYDITGRLIRVTTLNHNGKTDSQTFQYNDANEKTADKDHLGHTTTYAYDDLGRLITEVGPSVVDKNNGLQSPVISYKYDLLDNVTESIDGNGYHLKTRYTAYGKPIEIIYPDGTKERFTYFLDGSLKEAVDKKGIATIYDRDSLGRETLITLLDADSCQRFSLASTYSGFHLVKTIKDGKVTTLYTYDQAGRVALKEQHSPESIRRIHFIYDENGRIDSEIESWGQGHDESLLRKHVYSAKGDLIKTSLTDLNGVLLREILPPTKQETSTDIQESIISNESSQAVRQTMSKDSKGVLTILTYDALGRLVSVITKNSASETIEHQEFHYDLANHKIQETHFDALSTSILKTNQWAYDSCNRLTSFIEAADTSYSRTTNYYYDSKGQLEQISKPNGVTIFHHYSALGKLEEYYASDLSFHYRFIYDKEGRLTNIEDLINQTCTSRKFNTLGQIIEEELGNGLKITTDYDSIGRKIQLILPDKSSICYQYDALYLKLIKRFSSNHELKYTHSYTEYSLSGKVSKALLIGAAGTLCLTYRDSLCTSIDTPYWSQKIPEKGLDPFGNIMALEGMDSQGSWQASFSYDEKNALVEEAGVFNQRYIYDNNGNRLKSNEATYENNLFDELYLEASVQDPVHQSLRYTHDFNGNQVKKSSAQEQIIYQYDALDRLTSIEIENTLAVHYVYDAFYRRLSKTVSHWDANSAKWIASKTWRYLYDGDHEIGIVDDHENILELRILGTPLVGENQTEIASSIAHELNGRCFAPIHDLRGNVGCLIDSESGKIVESYRYSAFGNICIYSDSGERLNTSSLNNPWLFSSKRCDAESGLTFYGKRYYDPHTARWITKDPLGTFDGSNCYLFLHNNPLSHLDLYGLFSFPTTWKEIKEISSSLAEVLTNFKKNVSYHNYMQREWDQILEQFFHKGFLEFAGYYSHPIDSGCTPYGEEIDNKVRVTLINGILNVRYDIESLTKLFSKSHGDVPVHYVFRPTQGWTRDLFASSLSKLGYLSPYAKLLANTWKTMIQDMGGTGQGGKIIHYAHSIGGTDTYVAKNLLTEEEQKMIHVVSMGSPTMIPCDCGFASAINYVSKRDGVCLLDPIGYLMGYFYEKSKIEMVGSFWGLPFVDHTLYTDSYGAVIKELGAQFVGIYR